MLSLLLSAVTVHESIWLEAEWFAPLRGANFSYMKEDLQTPGSWSIAGPDVAAAWTQGGESEFGSIAARGDAEEGTKVSREIVVPTAGKYRIWVRYADYRNRSESFEIRVKHQAGLGKWSFGNGAVVDELDPMKLLWNWSYAWSFGEGELPPGPATVEIVTTGTNNARRCVDCLCLTTDSGYRPTGREKPDATAWQILREIQATRDVEVEPLVAGDKRPEGPRVQAPPIFLWNVGEQWWSELERSPESRVGAPFAVDPPLLDGFVAAFRGKTPELYGHKLSGPVWHVPLYPRVLGQDSVFLKWLGTNPESKFAVLLNYGEPQWNSGGDKGGAFSRLENLDSQFLGYIAGENIAYAAVDEGALEKGVRTAKSRAEILGILKSLHTEAVVKKFSDYAGRTLTADQAWSRVISCLSANNEAFCHALGALGVRRIGHENTGNSPTLGHRLAFLRGAARQFGCGLLDYQSANLGDSATMFSRESYFYPGSSRYVLDNSYDVWAGAGTNWLLKDYILWYLAGVDAFYNEQGIDMYWKPAGGAAGDEFPVQLSPKGKVAEAVQRLVSAHPRPEQFTPVAFLLDEAHGWSQERFQPGSFGLDPELNPSVLSPGQHEASLRAWFDVAYFPAPLTQNEPATAIRQTYVNGVFGDIFDVLVTARGKTRILANYPVVVAAGEIELSKEWGESLENYVRKGGTLVLSIDQLKGLPGELGVRVSESLSTGSSFRWLGEAPRSTNVFPYRTLTGGRVLATTAEGQALVTLQKLGKGQVVTVGVPMGIGLDNRPVAFLAPLLRHLVEGLTPLKVLGDVEWTLGKIAGGGWLVSLLNNRGVIKPQHGVLPTDHGEAVEVELRTQWTVNRAEEWMTETRPEAGSKSLKVSVPAGAVRLVALYPK